MQGFAERGHEVSVLAAKFDDSAVYPMRGRLDLRVFRQDVGMLRHSMLCAKLGALACVDDKERRRLSVALRAAATGCRSAFIDIVSGGDTAGVDFDVIIAHFGPIGVRAMYLQEAGLLTGPIVTVFHGADMSEQRTLERWLPHYRRLFRQSALLLPISNLWRDRLIEWGAPESRTKVHHVGVEIHRLTAQASNRPLNRPLKVLSVARFTEKKGLAYAIEGVRNCKHPIQLNLIGFGPLESTLRQAASDSTNEINFLGKCTHEQVFEELKNADVFLLPSVVASNGDMEGIPVSIMEAMATGVLVVATRHSGIPELVTDGVTGLLVDERSASAIAEALSAIVEGKVDIEAIRTNARRKVESDFNGRALDAELERLLNRTLGWSTPGAGRIRDLHRDEVAVGFERPPT
ncbi:glycosyltransferase [Caballeronia sp. LZ062]|uniref:glycosyltransferase n=1 Tax=unclassified Caballeronia TaxID=2646786 RepID=UPI00285D494B|nr:MULTISPECIES: glycosyltransferase [unclassified Caballeronia]MDR5857640.1 glycosyltransferase [Caballeronia sp. LZ050]MDR5869190.1 glycosyltransferase [Caballeronia sp. LZ062]